MESKEKKISDYAFYGLEYSAVDINNQEQFFNEQEVSFKNYYKTLSDKSVSHSMKVAWS